MPKGLILGTCNEHYDIHTNIYAIGVKQNGLGCHNLYPNRLRVAQAVVIPSLPGIPSTFTPLA